jgi:hypothetical protein
MPATCLIQKPVQSKGVDLALCKRLAQEACRRASAAESWATLVFGRLNRHEVSLDLARELADLAEKDAIEARKLIAALAYELKAVRA